MQKMKEWKEKSLSQAGKEVLIKAVIQSIPSYAMNCFLFPTSLCQDIEREAARFFWGSTLDERKCHWMCWGALTKPNAVGGIGFRELHYFNLAMIAKQVWNLLQHPSSIIFHILKAKYFRRKSLMDACLGYQPSYLWRSLLAAKQLVEDGLAWRIGDGKRIDITRDKWIGVLDQHRTSSHLPDELINAKVENLINSTNMTWKSNLIQSIFNGDEARKILAIPLGNQTTPDRMIWRHNKQGHFTVRTAYHAAVKLCSETARAQASSSVQTEWWRKLWDIKCIPRVRLFIWKACQNALPIKNNLYRRKCVDDPICPLCGEEVETVEHLMLRCPMTYPVWYTCPLRIDVKAWRESSFKNFLWSYMKDNPKECVGLLSYVAWEVWRARNAAIFERKKFNFHTVLQRAHAGWCDDTASREVERRKHATSAPQIHWKAPFGDKLKVNCDVVVMQDGKAGLGFVVRNNQGHVSLVGKTEVMAAGSSMLLECLAIR